ncbi:disease resistance protein [Rosa sericea]
MDCLCAIGNAVVGKIAEYTVEPFGRLVGRQVGYLIHYNKNLQNLRTQVKNLSVARDRVKQQVDEADRRGEKIHNDVQKWLDEVAQIIKDTKEFLKGKCQATGEPNEVKDESQANEEPSEVMKDEHQAKMKRPHQVCPNPRLRYQLSRKSTKLVEAVDELYKRKDFSIVSYSVRPQEVCVISDEDYEAFDSRISTLNKIMDELRSPSADMILVYGIGGVGKTTLVEEVLRQVTKDKLFDDAVMVRDVKIPNLEAIQKEIAEKLGLEVLSNQTISGRANRICERIKDKKTLVILDDVWQEVDLKTLGLPHIPTCKIVLTSRTRKVLSSDKIKQKVFLLGVLGENETWLLFEKKAGDVTKDPTILSIATQVAKKCGGLPVLIVTVARALENSSLPIWKNALRSLDRFDEKEELTEKAYMGLEWSYAQLNEQLKPLFVLCGTTIQGNSISLTNLLKYSMGLGFFKDHTVEEARNALYTQVDKLKSSCLLLDGDDNTCVRMHDLVHDVAIRIATRDHHVLVKDGIDQLKEWPDQDSFKRCSKISWSCCNIPCLPEIPWKCPELEMFRLHGNGEKNDHHSKIPSNFFGEMPKLKVLDICNLPLMLLPPSLALLKANLQTLCLDGCTLKNISLVGELSNLETLSFANSEVKKLPKEIAKLTHLRLLDLSGCCELEVISPNVISSLTRLEDLRMKNSFEEWEAEGDINERRNASLSELKHLSQLTALEICVPDVDILPPNLFSNNLKRYHIYIGGVWEERMAETTFNTLRLKLTPSNQSDQGLRRLMMRSEDLALDVMEGVNNSLYQLDNEGFLHLKRLLLQNCVDLSYIINKKVVLPNLTTLSIQKCDHLRFLFSCSMAESFVALKHLKISKCQIMEEVVSTTREYNEENMNNMFCKLETLELEQLPCLGRICTGTRIEFLSLKKLVITFCKKLKAFICDPMIDKSTKVCKEIEERESEESPGVEHETVSQYCLFDDKVRFPSLEDLAICALDELQTIWHNNQLADQDSFCRLKEVDVRNCKSLISIFPPSIMGRLNALERLQITFCGSLKVVFEVGGINVEETRVNTSSPYDQLKPLYCQNLEFLSIWVADSLKNIFPASLARGLQQLRHLSVVSCRDLLEIVGEEERGVELPTPPQFVFPKATDVSLQYLPQLKSFYPGKHTSKWPVLKKLEVSLSVKVKLSVLERLSVFQDKHESGPVKSLFPIDKGSFPNLKELSVGHMKIWHGTSPIPAESFSNLKYLKFYYWAPFSQQATSLFLQQLHNIERIEVISAPPEEIFVSEGNSSCEEIHAAGTLPSVRILVFSGCKMFHLGKENSGSGGPIFPNLEVLEVMYSHELKNLDSSAISFRNLTTLKVVKCLGLDHLITYSVAKSLMQLTTMEVSECTSIAILVTTDGDDAAKEITFSQLQVLTLHCLPNLQSFCSESCTVKLPSLTTLSMIHCDKVRLSYDDGKLQITSNHSDTKEDEEVVEGNESDEMGVLNGEIIIAS